MQVESVPRREPDADVLYGPGGYEPVNLGLESQKLSTRKRMSERIGTQRTRIH